MARSVIKNIDKVIRQMKALSPKVEDAIAKITEGNAQEIVINAKSNARNLGVFDNGKLVQGIEKEPKGKLNQVIFAREKYSAYMEFGTGGKVQIPEELKKVASLFKGNNIKEVNIQARPFLYTAFVKGREEFFKDLKANLKVLIERNG
jgi:HK97 gp10 family phage protein